MADSEFEGFTKRIHLVAHATKSGYGPCPRERFAGIALLEHPETRDRIAVARTTDGVWIYASLAECAPAFPEESPDETRRRLREGIARTADKGTVIEFEQRLARIGGLGDLSLEHVRERLRACVGIDAREVMPGRALDVATMDADANPEPAAPNPVRGARDLDAKLAMNRRHVDGSPSLRADVAQLQDRLARWDQAQRHIDEALGHPPPRLVSAAPPPRDPAPPARERALEPQAKASPDRNPELSRRHYDWTPRGGERLFPRGPRRPGPERGR